MNTGHFLLSGTDFEGDSRESWFMVLADALKSARACSRPDSHGPPWQAWEIWGNDEETEEWKPLLTSATL